MLEKLVERISAEGGALVVRGDPGIGKSSLLRAAVGMAAGAGHRALEATGYESEAQLPFAGLHQLLRGVVPAAEALRGPLRRALLSALGAEDGPPAEVYMVALAVLNLLVELATERPVVVAVDDVHWLDQPTQDVLTFVARRVDRDAVLVIGTVREGHASPLLSAGLPELEVPGLDEGAARELLEVRAAGLSVADRDRIVRQAKGNPLALVELPAGTDMLPLTSRLERAFAGRFGGLPPAARDAVLVAAVDHGTDLSEILSAATVLHGAPVTVEMLDTAVEVRLVRVVALRVQFRHPLVRSAVLQHESLTRRMSAHAALADVLVDGPYRRTWHRAESIVGTDDAVADELEASRTTSLKRGSVTAAIWALERSAQLTTDSAVKGRRLLLAARDAFGLGRADIVDRLVTAAESTKLAKLDQARVEWLKEIFSDGTAGDAKRVMDLCAIAERSTADLDLVLDLLQGAALRCWWGETGPEARARVVAVAEGLSVPRKDPRYIAVLAVAEPVLRGRAVHDLLSRVSLSHVHDAEALRLLGMAAHAIGDLEQAVDFLGRSEQALRREGRLGLLSHVLTMQINDHLFMGGWDRAVTVAEEGRRAAVDTGQPNWSIGSMSQEAIRQALRGERDQALETAATVEAAARPRRVNDLLAVVQVARGLAWLVTGDHERAYADLRRLYEPGDPSYHPRESFDGVMFFAEAAARAGRQADAAPIIAELERAACHTPASLLHVHLSYARAVLAPDEAAADLFPAALAADLTRWPLVRAKLELAYGEWLRRRRRIADSREPLRSALTIFEVIGATHWAEQARAELRATGERAIERAASPIDALSPQELQIARLAAEGLSNREIGERLFLSPRTIGSHLYRIFPKLGIASRTQLASRL